MKVKSKVKTFCSLVIRYFSSGVLLGGWRVKRSETLDPCFTYRRLVVFRSKRYTKRNTASPIVVLCIGYPYVLYRRLPLKRGCRIHEKIHAKERTLRALSVVVCKHLTYPCCGEGYASMLLATASLVCRTAPCACWDWPLVGYMLWKPQKASTSP